jgi:molybdopterin synthase sulfur carrier subunit
MAQVYLPRSLLMLFPTADRRPTIEAANVAQVIDGLDERWPGMRARLCDVGPTIREHINVFVDGERASLETRVGPASVVHVIPAVSGGSVARNRPRLIVPATQSIETASTDQIGGRNSEISRHESPSSALA